MITFDMRMPCGLALWYREVSHFASFRRSETCESMPTSAINQATSVWELPPLILHPFNERIPPSAVLENSKAALMLSGVIPADGTDPDELRRRLLAGRYSEIRMLFFLGKDVLRWVDQCVEWSNRAAELAGASLRHQSFAGLLTTSPPNTVREKLTRWGVADHPAIFCRAIGLNSLFLEPPPFELLSEEFLSHYHRYADAVYQTYMQSESHDSITSATFQFELYASGEYSKMLESAWESD